MDGIFSCYLNHYLLLSSFTQHLFNYLLILINHHSFLSPWITRSTDMTVKYPNDASDPALLVFTTA